MIGYLFLLILLTAAIGFFVNRAAARAQMTDGPRFHPMASFHGGYAVCLSALPALLFTWLFLLFESPVVDAITMVSVPEYEVAGMSAGKFSLIEGEIKSIARGNVFGEPEQ